MDNSSQLYELDGHEALGSYLQIQPSSDNAPDLSKCLIQWYRVSSEGDKKELISGTLVFSCFIFSTSKKVKDQFFIEISCNILLMC